MLEILHDAQQEIDDVLLQINEAAEYCAFDTKEL